LYSAAPYEIDILCLLLLGLIWYKAYCLTHALSQSFFWMLRASFVLCFADLLRYMLDGTGSLFLLPLLRLANSLFFVGLAMIPFFWFLYMKAALYPAHLRSYWRMTIYSLPILLMLFLGIASLFFDQLLFSLDSQHTYMRGQWHFVQAVVSYIYTLAAGILPFLAAVRERSYIRRRNAFLLASFVIFPILGGVLQTLYRVPTIIPAITVALFYAFAVLQENRISIDPLTKLNNRYQLYQYLSDSILSCGKDRPLILIMLDVDDFKQINDVYGHVAGDQALCCIAHQLRYAVGRKNCFLGRYGGDEFLIVCNKMDLSAVQSLIRDIQQRVRACNEQRNKLYTLSLSIGYAVYEETFSSMQEFIAAADRGMYEEKKGQKQLV